MQTEICVDPGAAAVRAAELIAGRIADAIRARGLASIALSGGTTPADMFVALAGAEVDWTRVHVFQVDERFVTPDDPARNWLFIQSAFDRSWIPASQMHAMPVDDDAPEVAMTEYAGALRSVAGSPSTLDVVHLGLGEDGHTASLFPGDPVLDAGGDVALAGAHKGLRRMTLTLGVINRARARVWLVTGPAKRAIVAELLGPDAGLVAQRITRDDSVLVMDRDAAGAWR